MTPTVAVSFDARSGRALVAHEDGRLVWWSLGARGAQRLAESTNGAPGVQRCVAARRDYACLAWQEEPFGEIVVMSFDEQLEVVDKTAIERHCLLSALAVAPGRDLVVLYGREEDLVILGRRLEPRARMSAGELVTGLSFDADERYAAAVHTSQGGGAIVVYDVNDGVMSERHSTLPTDPGDDLADTFGHTAFDAVGDRLVVARTRDRLGHVVAVYDVASGRPLWSHEVTTPGEGAAFAGFLSCDEVFVVTMPDRTVHIFDARTGERSSTRPCAETVSACAFEGRLWGIRADGVPHVL